MSQPIIEVQNLSKRYQLGVIGATTLRDSVHRMWDHLRGRAPETKTGEFWALRDVSFSVQPGEVLGVIGRNGAGKSTLLKILSRITEPTSGRAILRGRVSSLLEVGTGFHPELSGRDNIFLNGAILGMTQAETRRKFDEIVAFAEVEKFLDTPVKRYSSGMYVRLAFAVAAHLEPEILIVDEVLAVGDASFQKKCLGKIRDVSTRDGRTVLFVSHNMSAVSGLCNRVLWIDHGRVGYDSNPHDAIEHYLRDGSNATSGAIVFGPEVPGHRDERFTLRRVVINELRPVRHGEPLVFTFEFETHAAISHLSFGFGLCRVDGGRIISCDSDLTLPPRSLPAGVRGQITCHLPSLQIDPGTYLIDVGARLGDNVALAYFPSCAQVEVTPSPVTPPMIIHSDGGWRLPADWRWAPSGLDAKSQFTQP